MEKTIVCCLCVRDCEKYLKDIFFNLDSLGNKLSCLNFYIIFIYDNCIDNSSILLDEYKQNSKFNVIVINNENNTSNLRTVRISNSRNICLDIIENEIKNVDYHIFIDADDVNISIWDVDIIKDYIYNDNNEWDILSFNRENYYDIWALLYDDFKHQCWGFNTELNITYMKNDIIDKLNNLDEDKLFECISAFNGFAIYRTNKLKNIKYDGFYENYDNLFSDEDKQNTLNKFKIELKLPNLEFIEIKKDYDCCEHLYYNIIASRQNNARIRISKKMLEKK